MWQTKGDLASTLERLNSEFQALCHDKYFMTVGAVQISASDGETHFFSAGAPPIMLMRKDGTVDVLTCQGSPLGSARFGIGRARTVLAPGDRLFICTDGIVEQALANKRPFGWRRLQKALSEGAQLSPEELVQHVLAQLDLARGNVPQDDDVTMAVVSYAPKTTS
jgi:serine phosphatase RsbU (regulator of sigma subunit)